jgi:hypothetical protein
LLFRETIFVVNNNICALGVFALDRQRFATQQARNVW